MGRRDDYALARGQRLGDQCAADAFAYQSQRLLGTAAPDGGHLGHRFARFFHRLAQQAGVFRLGQLGAGESQIDRAETRAARVRTKRTPADPCAYGVHRPQREQAHQAQEEVEEIDVWAHPWKCKRKRGRGRARLAGYRPARNTTDRVFAGIGTIRSRTKPCEVASAMTSSSARSPQAGFLSRSEASKAALLGARSTPSCRNGP